MGIAVLFHGPDELNCTEVELSSEQANDPNERGSLPI
jgi:hypothetical protein